MRAWRSAVLIWALVLSGCGDPKPVITYPNGQTPPSATQPAPQPPQVTTPQSQPQAPAVNQPQAPQPSGPNGPGSFTARFLDRLTQAPIAGMAVSIVGTELSKTTGPDGKVTFASVPANAQYQTYHNDFVQVTADVPADAINKPGGVDITMKPMSEFQ